MLTKKDPNNPVVMLRTDILEGTIYAYFADIHKHIKRLTDVAMERENLPAPEHGFDIYVVVANDQEILDYEATTKMAVMTFEEAIAYAAETGYSAMQSDGTPLVNVDGEYQPVKRH